MDKTFNIKPFFNESLSSAEITGLFDLKLTQNVQRRAQFLDPQNPGLLLQGQFFKTTTTVTNDRPHIHCQKRLGILEMPKQLQKIKYLLFAGAQMPRSTL